MPISVNQCVFVGNVAGTPKYTPADGTRTSTSRLFFVLAVQRPTKFEGKYPVDFLCCQARGKQADDGVRYIGKGKQLAVVGALNLFGDRNSTDPKKKPGHVIAISRINYGPDSKRQQELSEETPLVLDHDGIEEGDLPE